VRHCSTTVHSATSARITSEMLRGRGCGNGGCVTMRSCRYGSDCHTAGCPFQHSRVGIAAGGRIVPEASSDRVHALQRCHFGNNCRNPACPRRHSPEPELAAARPMPGAGACRFGSACKNPRCFRTHPAPLAGAGAGADAGEALVRHSQAVLDSPAKHAGKSPALGTPAKPCFHGGACASAACGYGHPAGWSVRSGGGARGSTHDSGVL
jgi:hypothetical protein